MIVAIMSGLGAGFCAAGDWRTGLMLIVVAGGVIAAFWLIIVRPARIPRDAVVWLHLGGAIHEDVRRVPLAQLFGSSALSLRHLRYGLEAIATDTSVRAVIVQIVGVEAGLATAHELHRLLRAVGRGGKRVISIMTGDSPSVREYLIAAGAGEIVANPDVMLTMLGVAIGNPFVRDALEKAGVGAQILQWKEYKGAGEMFTRDAMSPAVRESLDAIIDDWMQIIAGAISQARGITLERARELAGAGFIGMKAAREAGLIDRAGYMEDLRAGFDPDGKRKCFVSFARYLRHAAYVRERGNRPRIALIVGAGPVIAGDARPGGEFISGETTAELFERASRDESVRAVVFRVNSPGGSAVGSDMVWRAMREAQGRGKPVIVSMGDVAGSGGYYVAMGADAIVAEPATITGSIGVVFAKFEVSRMLARLGVRFDFAKSGESSDAISIARPMSETELAQINAAIGEVYGNFTAKVAEGRRLDPGQAEALAKGRVWSGVAAKERGLIDELGGLARAIEIARARAHIPEHQKHRMVVYAPRAGLMSLRKLLAPGASATQWGADLIAGALGMPPSWAPAMMTILARGGALLLCPWVER
ncbi:MAG TPA: signal peptide peptidase SppA [Candidatus Binataceae bacterium]|nr:signal peptide peptidase SppA [Candidatus Binataceae bacterium]